MTSTPNISCPIPSYTESSPINSTRDVKHVVGSIFPQVDIPKVHHHDLSQEKTHCNISHSNFKHEWLYLKAKSDGKSKNNNTAFDVNAGLWWLIYIDGMGMFCLLCMKHMQWEARLSQFCEKPSVCMRLGTLGDHRSSGNHKSSVQVEHTQRVSHFHKLAVQKDAAQDVHSCLHTGSQKKRWQTRSSLHCWHSWNMLETTQ